MSRKKSGPEPLSVDLLAIARYQPLDEALIVQTVQLFIFLLERFGDWIIGIISGQMDLTAALEMLPASG